jgi:predicted methyltransferase MtxX (methanogen marker protein 4)
MMKLLRRMMISCIKSTELMEKRNVVGLSPYEKINLFFHKSMCDACTAYEKQSKLIDKLLHRHIHSAIEGNISPSENKELKERIISIL